jgi:hypothetical protein
MDAMDDALFVTLMSDLLFSSGSVMSATLEAIKENASFVELLESPMLIIVLNVSDLKRTAMDVPRSSTWALPRLTCFMKGKNTGLKKGRNWKM